MKHRTGGRQPGQVGQLGEAVFVRPQQEGVAGERGIEGVRGSGVGAHRLHPTPRIGASSASQRRTRSRCLGVWGPRVVAFRNAFWSVARSSTRCDRGASSLGEGAVLPFKARMSSMVSR